MADAQATFAIVFDTSNLKRGAAEGDSALMRQAATIKRVSKELDSLKAAQKRLLASASVKQYLQQQKAIEATQRKAAGLEKKLADAQGTLEIAKQVNSSVGPENAAEAAAQVAKLTADVEKYTASLGEARAEVERLEAVQGKLGQDDAVKAYKDKTSVINQQEGQLADLQAQFDRAGGGAADLADKVEQPTSALKLLGDASKELGGSGAMGGALDKFQKFKDLLGKGGGIAVAIAVVVALTVAVIAATVALTRMGLAAADAFRSARIARQGAANGSVAGAEDIEAAMKALRMTTGASKEEASELASELYKLGYRGKGLEDAAVTIERFGVAGEEAKSKVKALYEQLSQPAPPGMRGFVVTKDMLPRDQYMNLARALGRDANKALMYGSFQAKSRGEVADALKKIGSARFGDLAASQMLSLGKLAERAKENVADLFTGLKIDLFLGAMRKVVMLFDQSTSSGKALKKLAEVVLQPIINVLTWLAPLAEGFFEGVIYALLKVAIYALRAYIAFKKLFPGSFFKDLDLAEVGFAIGAGAVGAMVLALLALGAVLTIVAVAALVVAVVMLAPFILGAVAVYGLVKALQAVLEKLGLISKSAEGAGGSIRSLAQSLPGVGGGDAATAAGGAVGDGLVAGMTSKIPAVMKAGAALASAADTGVTTKAMIQSPSKLMRLRGQQMGEGERLGLEDAAPSVERQAAESLVPAAGAGAGGAASGGGGVVLNVMPGAVVINGVTGADQMNDEGFLRALARALFTAARSGGGPAPAPAT